MPGGGESRSSKGQRSGAPGGGGFGGFGGFGGNGSRKKNTVTLTSEDMEEILTFVPGLNAGTMSYTTNATVDGGELEESTSYTVAGVRYNYAEMSNLEMAIGAFLEEDDDTYKNKYCVLGSDVAKEVYGSAYDAYGETIYIDDRSYTVVGVISEMGTVASGISPDTAIFVPYETGIKYLTGNDISPTITVIADDTGAVDTIKANIETVLSENYTNANFAISDAGSKMEAANQSNRTLTLLLYAMAAIVFVVGGIGIMNVLFVSVKERTNEIGILKAIGCSHRDILLEFLLEASTISFIGSAIGVICAVGIMRWGTLLL